MQKEISAYVIENVNWYIDHEHEHPEEYGAKILEISNRWGF